MRKFKHIIYLRLPVPLTQYIRNYPETPSEFIRDAIKHGVKQFQQRRSFECNMNMNDDVTLTAMSFLRLDTPTDTGLRKIASATGRQMTTIVHQCILDWIQVKGEPKPIEQTIIGFR